MFFRVATYNIHKGFSHFNRRLIIHQLRDRLEGLDPDIIFLQEVQGKSARHARRHHNWPLTPQHEFLATTKWSEVAYSPTAINRHGHHGNAILAKHRIIRAEHQDISAHILEQRGLLHCEIELAADKQRLHCINVHLGLGELGRLRQLGLLCERIEKLVPHDAPLIVAGDFNDWRRTANKILPQVLGVKEIFQTVKGRSARTFPAGLPIFQLDRIYVRGLTVQQAAVIYGNPRSRLSDHAALVAGLSLP